MVIELKRTEDGGHMELQAVRYAAMVSRMTFDRAVDVYARYLRSQDDSADARERLLTFLNWDSPNEELFAQNVRIVLASRVLTRTHQYRSLVERTGPRHPLRPYESVQ